MAYKSKISNQQSKILVIVGPNSSGKSELSVKLAKKFQGEIISCDSRQVYRGMDLGTGKVPGQWKTVPHLHRGKDTLHEKYFLYKGIIHHLIDFVSPKRQYSAALFQKQAQKAVKEIHMRGHLPILCGGTGHWVDAVALDQQLPEVKPNLKLRAKLERQSAEILYNKLAKLDPVRAKSIDPYNRRRLIRALEIVLITGKPVPALRHSSPYDALWIGINQPQNILHQKIDKRLKQRVKAGMIKEIRQLHRQGLSWKRLNDFGLEYRYISSYLQGKLSSEEMLSQLSYAIKHYAKRQMTWFRKNPGIRWVTDFKEASKLTDKFLAN